MVTSKYGLLVGTGIPLSHPIKIKDLGVVSRQVEGMMPKNVLLSGVLFHFSFWSTAPKLLHSRHVGDG